MEIPSKWEVRWFQTATFSGGHLHLQPLFGPCLVAAPCFCWEGELLVFTPIRPSTQNDSKKSPFFCWCFFFLDATQIVGVPSRASAFSHTSTSALCQVARVPHCAVGSASSEVGPPSSLPAGGSVVEDPPNNLTQSLLAIQLATQELCMHIEDSGDSGEKGWNHNSGLGNAEDY